WREDAGRMRQSCAGRVRSDSDPSWAIAVRPAAKWLRCPGRFGALAGPGGLAERDGGRPRRCCGGERRRRAAAPRPRPGPWERVAVERKRSEGPCMSVEAGKEVATLGGGCFWCLEAVYQELRGVEKVESGYSGGHVPNPTYEQVSTGTTGHAEVVQITF